MKSTLFHPTAFGVLKSNCFGYEKHTVSSYSFWSFKVKLFWLWTAHCAILQECRTCKLRLTTELGMIIECSSAVTYIYARNCSQQDVTCITFSAYFTLSFFMILCFASWMYKWPKERTWRIYIVNKFHDPVLQYQTSG